MCLHSRVIYNVYSGVDTLGSPSPFSLQVLYLHENSIAKIEVSTFRGLYALKEPSPDDCLQPRIEVQAEKNKWEQPSILNAHY